MQRSSNKDPDQINNADSFATLFGSGSSQCYSPKQTQFSLSMSVATELKSTAEHSYPIKLVEPMYQEQDSSSTLSTGQSHREAATFARSNFPMQNASFKHGLFETCKKRGDDYARPALPHGNEDCITQQVQMEHNQSSAGMSYPFDGPYFGRITAAYEPYAAVCPQMMGMAPPRVVLPLDCTEGAPIYVNAKQYHAIIRRRQSRAKLEAQNKVGRSRKPYLHESRHLHALKRARGSGGRFLNTKNMEKPKPSNQTHEKNLSLLQLNRDASEPKIQHSENNSWGATNTSGSNASCILRNDEIFQQPDLRGSISALSIGATAHIGAHSRMLAPPDDRLMLTVDRRAHISTVT